MLRPCPLSISCRAGRSEGDKAAISRSTVATQPRGGTVAGQIFFSKKIHIYPKPKFQGVSYNRKAFPIWWWGWIRTFEAQDCPVLAPLVSGNPTFRRCLANTRPIRPLHSRDHNDRHHHQRCRHLHHICHHPRISPQAKRHKQGWAISVLRYCFLYSCIIWKISYIAISRISWEILCDIFGLTGAPLNYISLHRKPHKKSVRIYSPAGTWNFWGAKKDTCIIIHACVAKRVMWWLRAFCHETQYAKFTSIFRILKNIVYRIHLARFALIVCISLEAFEKKTLRGGLKLLLLSLFKVLLDQCWL